ncbi:hypothetical protein [Candidatus Ichthyocystis hellenicum]|uniref:hypothetical protein n=1 Tax=Candidatus Ichthyocystis hellenicum TaxID=1561003 RepID=UPI0015857C75|nr:hypothetical protein [Candidatus Ichthyocystis hellenicum]
MMIRDYVVDDDDGSTSGSRRSCLRTKTCCCLTVLGITLVAFVGFLLLALLLRGEE